MIHKQIPFIPKEIKGASELEEDTTYMKEKQDNETL